jgi:CRP/FNR family cyclic AMP-dependent transcriptional regulator
LLAKGEGNFTYTSGLSSEEKELPVIGGFMGLIMEGMRRVDEQEA